MKNNIDRINLKKELQSDDVFVSNKIVPYSEVSKLPSRKGYDQAIISNGKIVNIISNSGGHLPNELFFNKVEEQLINAEIDYTTRSINRDDRTFVVDYILNNDDYIIEMKKDTDDKIRPMLRFTNSYDGTIKTSGHFGYFREICSNGLHVSNLNIGFSLRRTKNICEIVLPEISNTVSKFLDNEYFTIKKKFTKLDETIIHDRYEFIKEICAKTKVFKFEASDKNPEPSLNARLVNRIMEDEMMKLNSRSNLWLGYNAFNEVIHTKLKMNFKIQKKMDARIFETVLSL